MIIAPTEDELVRKASTNQTPSQLRKESEEDESPDANGVKFMHESPKEPKSAHDPL